MMPGKGNGNPLQYSCLENSMDRGAWWAPVHGVSNSRAWLSNQHTHPKNTGLVANWSKCWHRFAFSRVLQSTSKSSMASHWVAKNSQFSMVHWKVGIYQWGKLIHYVRVHSVDSFSTIHIKSSLCAKVPELIFPWCPEQWWPGCVLSLLEDGWFTLAFALCILR